MNSLYISGCSYVIGAGLPDCHLSAHEIQHSIGSNIRREMKLRLFRLMLCTHEGSTNICTRTDLFRFFHAKIHYKRHNGENNRTSCVFGAVLFRFFYR